MKHYICLALIICLAAPLATAQRSPRGDSLKLLLEEAGGRLHRKDYPAAIEKFNLVLKIDPNNVTALRNLGAICMDSNDPKNGKDYFERAYKIDPNDPAVNNNLGAIASNEKKSDLAIQFFQSAVRLDNTNVNFKVNLALEYARAKQNGKAMPLLKQIDILSPDIPVVLYTLGNCYASIGKFDSAETCFDRAVSKGEKVDDLFFHRGTVKQALKKVDQAEKDYLTALEINAKNVPCRQELGMMYIFQRRFAEAAKQFESLVKVDSTNDFGWIGLGASYSLAGRTADGDKVLERLFAKDSTLGFQLLRFVGDESKAMSQEKQKR